MTGSEGKSVAHPLEPRGRTPAFASASGFQGAGERYNRTQQFNASLASA